MLKKVLLYASTLIHLFNQICHDVKSAECRHIKGTTHSMQKFSLAANSLEDQVTESQRKLTNIGQF